MKPIKQQLVPSRFTACLGLAFLWFGCASLFAAPDVVFFPLTNGQAVIDLSSVGGSVTSTDAEIASVTFSIHELDIHGGNGRWWNGSRFQVAAAALSAVVSGTNWSRAGGVALPLLNSGQNYELT